MNPSVERESEISFSFKAIPVKQPIGEFYVGVIPARRLCEISDFDVRRLIRERDVETYLGIQRPLSQPRVDELRSYIQTMDACFPTAIILAVDQRCAQFDSERGELTLRNDPSPEVPLESILYRQIARVLDGQHRIAGLSGFDGTFDCNVSIFVDADLADQAYIFSTVNLAQTKVNKSLAYDLAELAEAPSPQKTCHNIAVALDRTQQSPFFKRIKRLGTATVGRQGERLTQATFVEALMPFISSNPLRDRDILRRGKRLEPPSAASSDLPFRVFFLEHDDVSIAQVVMNFFNAVKSRWPKAWVSDAKGDMLSRTNGFRALMRALKSIYAQLSTKVPSEHDFATQLSRIPLTDDDFTTERFKPGGAGELDLYKSLIAGLGLNPR